jgi:hypothetical protein
MIPPPLRPRVPGDHVGVGVGIAILCQAVLIVAGPLAILTTNPLRSRISELLFTGWGVAQWLFLLPLYFVLRLKGRRLAAKGILITGCIGFLLNAACDAVMSGALRSL